MKMRLFWHGESDGIGLRKDGIPSMLSWWLICGLLTALITLGITLLCSSFIIGVMFAVCVFGVMFVCSPFTDLEKSSGETPIVVSATTDDQESRIAMNRLRHWYNSIDRGSNWVSVPTLAVVKILLEQQAKLDNYQLRLQLMGEMNLGWDFVSASEAMGDVEKVMESSAHQIINMMITEGCFDYGRSVVANGKPRGLDGRITQVKILLEQNDQLLSKTRNLLDEVAELVNGFNSESVLYPTYEQALESLEFEARTLGEFTERKYGRRFGPDSDKAWVGGHFK